MNKSYKTDRLLIKTLQYTKQEAKLVLDFYTRNKMYFQPWDPIRSNEFYTLEYHRKILRWEFNARKKGNYLRFWIFKKSDESFEKVIGTIAITNIVKGYFQSCFLGYCMDEDEVNKGFTTEAVKKVIDIIFNELKLHRIEANIMPQNKASLRVVEKLGFKNEGLAKKYLKVNEKWEDHIHMTLLNDKVE